MPWIKQEACNGCGVCVHECPVWAISISQNWKARIDMESCIHCGRCHDICPQKAIRHDSERIYLDVEENIKKTKRMMHHFNGNGEKKRFLGRMMNHFRKERAVAERTLRQIKILGKQM